MTRLVIYQQASPEISSSEELQYLRTLLTREAKQVFANVTYTSDLNTVPENAYVLFLNDPQIMITETSLMTMKRELDRGKHVAIANSITHFAIPIIPQTLNMYRQIESDIINNKRQINQQTEKLDVAMWSSNAWNYMLSDSQFELEQLNQGNIVASGLQWVRHGIYYQFDDYYGFTRHDILKYIPPSAKHILDVGCARGFTGELIQKSFDCYVTGIELNPVIAKEASTRLHQVITGDILDIELKDTYDTIIATEVIEHLTNPTQFIEKLCKALQPTGRIILTTPNIGHYSIVQDLISGYWDYIPTGLLCYTHIRFFTKNSLVNWIQDWGIKKYQIIPQMTDLPDPIKTEFKENSNPDWDSLRTIGFYIILDP